MALIVATPGGLTRFLIRDMATGNGWRATGSHATKEFARVTITVYGGIQGVSLTARSRTADGEPEIHCNPGPFRAWRLRNAVRRLTAALIVKGLR